MREALRAVAPPFVASRAIVLALLILFGNLEVVRTSFGFVNETPGAMSHAGASEQLRVHGHDDRAG